MNTWRDIGRMGENSFAALCAEIGLVANKSDVDTTGWDYFVEFPFDDIELVPLDMQRSALECKIQVKSTDKITYRYPLKVSNLRRLATALSPAFIVILGFNNKNAIQEAYFGVDPISWTDHPLKRRGSRCRNAPLIPRNSVAG